MASTPQKEKAVVEQFLTKKPFEAWLLTCGALLAGLVESAKWRTVIVAFMCGVSSKPLVEFLGMLRLSWMGNELKKLSVRSRVVKPLTDNRPMPTPSKLTPADEDALPRLRELIDNLGWKDVGAKAGTSRYQMSKAPSHLCKGSSVIFADFDLVLRYMADWTNFDTLIEASDPLNYERRVIEKIDDNHAICYGAYRLPSSFGNRDFVWQCTKLVLPGRQAVIIAKSVERVDVPERKADNMVRGEIIMSGYWFREKRLGEVEVDYVVQADPKSILPTWIVNSLQRDQADNVTRVKAFLEVKQTRT